MSVCFSSASVQAGGLSSSGGQGLSVLASRRGKGISHIKDGRVDWQNHLNENLAIFIKTLKWSHSWTSIFTSRIYPVETVSVYRKKKKQKTKQHSMHQDPGPVLMLGYSLTVHILVESRPRPPPKARGPDTPSSLVPGNEGMGTGPAPGQPKIPTSNARP